MKKAIFVFFLISALACDSETMGTDLQLEISKIAGSWQVITQSYSIGGPLIIETIEDGGIYEFVLDGTFTFKNAKNVNLDFLGKYTFEEEILTLDYILFDEPVTRTLKAQFAKDTLELVPINPMCIEGCSFTLQRL